MQAHLVNLFRKSFDLVISFSGSESCSPELQEVINKHFDPQLVFSKWNQKVIDKLIEQQYELKKQGRSRHVLILMDDIILDSCADFSLANMAMRGRHFDISLMCLSVSYTSIDKRIRRSLDCLLLFSCPMSGDMKILCHEYTRSPSTAQFCLNSLEEHTALVMQTMTRRQRLYQYRAPVNKRAGQNAVSHPCTQSNTAASGDSQSHSRMEHLPAETSDVQHNIQLDQIGDSETLK
jgi:hypothetical protein